LAAVKTVIKLFQKCTQFFANVFNFFCVHVDKLPNNVIYKTYRQNIFNFLSLYGAVILGQEVWSGC
jgi:hypothetical protein